MHIAKQTSDRLTIHLYPKFLWTLSGFLTLAGFFLLLSILGDPRADPGIFQQSAFCLLGGMVAALGSKLKTFEFDRPTQCLYIRHARVWRQQTEIYPIDSITAVRLNSETVSANGRTYSGQRIELVYRAGQVQPMMKGYSDATHQRQVAIAIGEFLNVPAEVPPGLEDAINAFMDFFQKNTHNRK